MFALDSRLRVTIPAVAPGPTRFLAILLAALLAALLAPADARAVNACWIAGNGSWNTAANWNPSYVPIAPGDSAACETDSGTYTITLNVSPTIDRMVMANPDAALNLSGYTLTLLDPDGLTNSGLVRANNSSTISGAIRNAADGRIIVNQGQTLNLGGPTLDNDGLLQVSHTGAWDTWLHVVNDLSVSGTGAIFLNGDNQGDYIYSDAGATLTQQAGHTIHGCGVIRLPLVNHGLVSADKSGEPLWLSQSAKTNDALMQATAAGTLRIDGIPVSNAGGTILADGGNVEVYGWANIIGGTLRSVAPSQISGTGPCTLTDVAIADDSRFTVNQGQEMRLAGAGLVNDGTLWISHTGAWDTWLQVMNDLSLTGGGDIYLNGDNEGDYIFSDAGATLTQQAGHTIHGCGGIRLPFVNHGLVSADKSTMSLWLSGGSKTNDALMQATAGGTLRIDGVTVTNNGGTIWADGGDVLVTNANLVGGTLRSTAGSQFTSTGISTLTDANLTPGSRWVVNQGQEVRLAGAGLVNDGTLWISHTGAWDTWLQVMNDLSLTGAGDIYLNGDNEGDYIYSDAGATLTQQAGHTIHGCGGIRLPFVNHGLVSADKSTMSLWLSGGSKTNDALMQATAGGTLRIDGVTVTNNGGTILADSGAVLVTNANLVGGTLRSTAGSQFTSTGISTLTDATLAPGSRWVVNQGQEVRLAGAGLVNDGTLWISHTGAWDTWLQVMNDLSVSGSGDIYLNGDNEWDYIYSNAGATLTQQAGHRIHGCGSIRLPLVNYGTVSGDYPGRNLTFAVGTFNNQGIAEASGQGTLRMDVLPANYANRTLTGGTWRAFDNSALRMIGAYVDTCAADIRLDGPNSKFYRDAGTADALAGLAVVREGGAFRISSGRNFTTAGTLTNAGAVEVGAGSQFTSTGAYAQLAGSTRVDGVMNAPSLVDLQHGRLSGSGRINQSVRANGRVLPGASIDTLTIAGDYTQDVEGSLHIELGGTLPGESDLLLVTGQASLAGQLWVTKAEGFEVEDGDIFVILQAAGVSGQFLAPFMGQCPEPGICFEIAYGATSVVLTAHAIAPGGVDEPTPATALPAEFRLQARSEAGGGSVLSLELPRAAGVRLDLFDVTGRYLVRLAEGDLPAGTHLYRWDGRRAAGGAVRSGLVFAQARFHEGGRERLQTVRLLTVR